MIDIDEDNNDIDIYIHMINYIMEHKRKFIEKIPCKTSMHRGVAYILEVFLENQTGYYENFCMRPYVFRNLCDQLKMVSLIGNSKDMSIKESVAMGVWIFYHGIRQRIVA